MNKKFTTSSVYREPQSSDSTIYIEKEAQWQRQVGEAAGRFGEALRGSEGREQRTRARWNRQDESTSGRRDRRDQREAGSDQRRENRRERQDLSREQGRSYSPWNQNDARVDRKRERQDAGEAASDQRREDRRERQDLSRDHSREEYAQRQGWGDYGQASDAATGGAAEMAESPLGQLASDRPPTVNNPESMQALEEAAAADTAADSQWPTTVNNPESMQALEEAAAADAASSNANDGVVYVEGVNNAADYMLDDALGLGGGDVVFVEEVSENIPLPLEEVTFQEGPTSGHEMKDLSLGDVVDGLADVLDDAGDLGEEFEKLKKYVPGTQMDEDELDDAPKAETNYLDDGDLSKFLGHITEQYPANIPQHDGRSQLGCERAVSWLERLNSEISKNIRLDTDNSLDSDIHKLEEIRVNVMRDILVLKNHLAKLKKRFKEENKKSASLDIDGIPSWTSSGGDEVEYSDLKKEASTPRKMVIAVPPFQRAITGILINAHISGGHPMEDVYEFLSKKYSIEPREELAIMQVCMDSGFPIFKDRGTYSGGSKDSNRAMDFVRNYFA